MIAWLLANKQITLEAYNQQIENLRLCSIATKNALNQADEYLKKFGREGNTGSIHRCSLQDEDGVLIGQHSVL